MTELKEPLIQIEDLTKVFLTDEVETHALSGVWLAINRGEYVAMSGPSGCGKRSLQFAKETLDRDKKQLELRATPAMDVTKAGAEMENREQELTTAKTTLELQESLIKNALTKNLDDLVLEGIPVVPTEKIAVESDTAQTSLESLTAQALRDRPELRESVIDLDNRDISRAATRNALLPSLALQAYYGGTGLAGVDNPASGYMSSAPGDYGSSVRKAFDNSSPDYLVGLSLRIPIRNRILKSDQYRSDLEYRQSELRVQQLKKQIRIEVRNAVYALQQSQARVASAQRRRDLAQKTFARFSSENSNSVPVRTSRLCWRNGILP